MCTAAAFMLVDPVITNGALLKIPSHHQRRVVLEIRSGLSTFIPGTGRVGTKRPAGSADPHDPTDPLTEISVFVQCHSCTTSVGNQYFFVVTLLKPHFCHSGSVACRDPRHKTLQFRCLLIV